METVHLHEANVNPKNIMQNYDATVFMMGFCASFSSGEKVMQ